MIQEQSSTLHLIIVLSLNIKNKTQYWLLQDKLTAKIFCKPRVKFYVYD